MGYKFPITLHTLYEAHIGSCYFQVTLHSQVKATLTVNDAWLDLQDGFVHAGQDDGRPVSGFFPLVISPTSRAGLLFRVCLGNGTALDENKAQPESILNISYRIAGDRTIGAHPPVAAKLNEIEGTSQDLIFRSALILQRPVLDPCLAVGFLPLPSDGLRVGQLVTMKWRVERLKDIEESRVPQTNDDVLYEVNANSENWMIAGRKRGHVSLSTKQGLKTASLFTSQ
ncbi:hypothetical protein Goari_017579 [Gossypium aridum]|uniref:TRAPPC10/Trs130 C-terminal domain-containing protein n=1 Tax=Gossypium aridum TaxID=34290 RepID=A0A7J8WMG6_GOSAI|nr:hypothetical protein [Gossypium aridum]